ncbi:hypothetical protein LINPERHAP2_LOCUS30397 [Linum perenne]
MLKLRQEQRPPLSRPPCPQGSLCCLCW